MDLMKLSESEMSGENILYKNILKEDDEGAVTLFVDKIFDFDKMDRFAYVKELEKNLQGKRYGKLISIMQSKCLEQTLPVQVMESKTHGKYRLFYCLIR